MTNLGSLCLTRLMSELVAFHSKLTGVMMCKHMDDGVLVGPDEALDRTLTATGKVLLLKTSCPQLGSETKFLGRMLIKTETGLVVKPLAKLFDSLLSCAGFENCNSVHSLGERSESEILDEKPLLGNAEHSLYRTIVGKLMFIAAERPDIQYCGVKECARGVQSPSARDMQRAKRICRYLMGTRDWKLKPEPCRHVANDSDWATDEVDRRPTSAGCAAWSLHNHHLQPNTGIGGNVISRS